MHKVLVFMVLITAVPVRAHDSLLLAFHHSPPFSNITEDGRSVGLDLELAKVLGKEIGFNVKAINCPFARCLVMMQKGQADLILDIIKNDTRQVYMDYVLPAYYTTKPSFTFYKRRGSRINVKNYAELQNFSIAYTRAGAYFERFDKDAELNKVPTLTTDKSIELLVAGRVDLVIGVESTFDVTLKSMSKENHVDKVEYKEVVPIDGFMAISKKSRYANRINEFSAAVIKLKNNGVIGGMVKKHGIESYHQ